MVKTLTTNATYEPSKRSFNWLKLKKDYINGEGDIGDSLDLVVVGADFGVGKRTGTFGSFLLACWNEDRERLETVCKVGTGFSDEALQ
jgi:DNA ligase-1